MLLAVTNPLRVVERIADHSDRNPVAVLLPVVVALVDLCQIRAVGQVVDRAQDQSAFHPRQHLYPTCDHLLPELVKLGV